MSARRPARTDGSSEKAESGKIAGYARSIGPLFGGWRVFRISRVVDARLWQRLPLRQRAAAGTKSRRPGWVMPGTHARMRNAPFAAPSGRAPALPLTPKDSPMTGFDRQTISDTTAKMLLEVQAVHFNAEKPYIFTSGWASPVYIDCRKLISYPRVRRGLMEMAETTILRDVGYEQIDAVAGGETAGIPFAAWLSDRLMVPMQYVRKKPKGFGRNAQIEGLLTEGQRVLLVEDLTTDSRSKINFINALRTAGAKVNHCFVLFHYNIFKESVSVLKDIDVDLHALATWWDVLRVAKQSGYFETKTLDEVEKFLHAPAEWSAAHGGATAAPQ
jgi:orotate phosphoribosyltransferase